MITGKHKNYLGVGEVVKSHCYVCVAADTIFWTTYTLGNSLTSRQMYVQKVTGFVFFFYPLFSLPPC